MALALASTPFSPAASSDPQGHTASSPITDATSILQLNYAILAEATTDPVWLADQLFSEGILDYHIKNELETTDKSSYDKATRLWSAVMTAVKHQGNPTQTLLTVCHVMKQRRELAQLADSMISQLGPQGSQQDGDDTAVEMESGVTESVLRGRDLVRNVTHSPHIPLEQPRVTSDVGDDPKVHGYSNTRLSVQEMWLGIARVCYVVAMTSTVLYIMHTIYGIDVTWFCLVSGDLLLQFLWVLFRKEFGKLICGLFLTSACFELLLIPLLGIIRFNIVIQLPIYVEVLDYYRKEATDFTLLMFLFGTYFWVVTICSVIFVILAIEMLDIFIVVIVIWLVYVTFICNKKNLGEFSGTLVFSNIHLYSYAPIIIFPLIFELFLWNRVHQYTHGQNFYLSLGQVILAVFFFSLAMAMSVGMHLIVNHPVSTYRIYWKKALRFMVFFMLLKQFLPSFFLHLYPGFPQYFIAIIIIIITVSLSSFSSWRVFMSVALVLIVLVLFNTIHTYKFWSVPEDELATALHGFFSQFSLVGSLIYTFAYEL